ncbi:hypothetical protein ABID81_002943 [Frigoribacterium sp. PvP054]|jgi:hypothetical protein|uniref:hypothetical protein n=1 Tax=Frigoribacterium sp. PvP054 TaxID=3156438 RepID=UPI003392A659
MDDDDRDRGRWRLQKPTFRGSAVGWGISAVVWSSCLAWALAGLVQGDGDVSVGPVLLVGALVVASAVCVAGTVSTVRHPRAAPPAEDAR